MGTTYCSNGGGNSWTTDKNEEIGNSNGHHLWGRKNEADENQGSVLRAHPGGGLCQEYSIRWGGKNSVTWGGGG